MRETIETITKEQLDQELARRTRICGSRQNVINQMCEHYTVI